MTQFRAFAVLLGLLLLAACDAKVDNTKRVPMGNFAMGLNIVVPETAQTVPISRQAKPEEWKAVMTQAMVDRFGGYEGDKLFDFGISIDGYVLAPPGIPVIASPRSALIITVNVWDDAKKELLVKGGKRITVLEGVSAETFVGSGWTQNKKAQMTKLATNAAKSVQDYMLSHPEWLGLPGANGVVAPTGDATATPAIKPAAKPASLSPPVPVKP